MKIKRNTKALYVIENMDSGRVKIGVSNNPEARIKNLMCQGGCLMRLKYVTHHIDNYAEVESNLHNMFIDKRYVGEWFNILSSEAIKAMKKMVRDRHDCSIIRKFEEGISIYDIALSIAVSRTAIVNYLQSKGYTIKDRKGKMIAKPVYAPAEPYIEKSGIKQTRLEKMVEANNKKQLANRKTIK